jgi:periplasmic mercuric ion binding protein
MKTTWIAAGLSGLVVAGGLIYAGAQSAERPAAEAAQASASFSVENMTCATCPISVKKAMMRVAGVTSVDIDYGAKTATVVFDPALTTPEEIAAASTDVGYPATPQA